MDCNLNYNCNINEYLLNSYNGYTGLVFTCYIYSAQYDLQRKMINYT